MKRLIATCAIGCAALLAAGQTSFAAETQIVIEIDGIFRAAEGEVVEVFSEDVPEAKQGLVCSGEAVAENNSSVHPNNDLVLKTGTTEATMLNVEAEEGKVTPLSGTVTLGTEIIVDLVMGPEGVFSGAIVITLDCEEPPPATTQPPPATTESPVTTQPPTTEVEVVPPTVPDTEVEVLPPESTTTTTSPPLDTQLPATGPSRTGISLMTGVLLLGGGALVMGLARRGSDLNN
jgi:LPXTG-motif cell wall-anchored protein